jgi:hypothetical protein
MRMDDHVRITAVADRLIALEDEMRETNDPVRRAALDAEITRLHEELDELVRRSITPSRSPVRQSA